MTWCSFLMWTGIVILTAGCVAVGWFLYGVAKIEEAKDEAGYEDLDQ